MRGKTITNMTALFLLALGTTVLLSGCREAGLYAELGPLNQPNRELELAPSRITIQVDTSTLFAALGGTAPYSYSVVSGTGTIDPTTGIYTAPPVVGNEQVRVTDADGSSATASVRVVSSDGALDVAPLFATVPPGESLDLIISGGSALPPNYSVEIVTNETGSPSVSMSGVDTYTYTAGNSEGTDTIRVGDVATGEVRYARIAVAAGSTNVDYHLAAVDAGSLAGGGTAGQPFTFINAFVIENLGSDNGGTDLFWRIYHSVDGTLGSGDTLLDQGIVAGGIASGDTYDVDISGTWPFNIGSGNLFVHLSSQDDLNLSNNQSPAIATTIIAPEVDYEVASVTHDAGTISGEGVTGTFVLANAGADAGTSTVFWTVYASLDTAVDGTDAVISTGQTGPLGGTPDSTTIAFSGVWPGAPGDYYLIASVAGSDDIDASAASNTQATGVPVSVTAPTTEADMFAGALLLDPNFGAGGTASGTLTIENLGPGDATSEVAYVIYASTDDVLDPNDKVIGSGSVFPLPAGVSTTEPFSGTWPGGTGTYRIFGEVISSEDPIPGNNVRLEAAPVTLTAPEADYTVSSISPGITDIHIGGPVTGTFSYRNNGPDNGVANLSYEVWASTNLTVDPSADHLIDAGGALPPLPNGATSGAFGFSGNWPIVYGSYYLIVRVSSTDDTNSGNDAVPTPGTHDVGIYDEEPSEFNGNYYDVTSGSSNAFDPGIVLQPGARILVRGTGTAADVDPTVDAMEFPPGARTNDDIIAFNTGTANYVTFTWTMDSGLAEELRLFVMYGDNLFFTGVGGTASELTHRFLVDVPNEKRWVDLENSNQADIGTYSLVISAE